MFLRKSLAFSAVLALIGSIGCGGGGGGGGESHSSAPAAKKEAAAPTGSFGTSSIAGKVTFEGAAPVAAKVSMDADPYCSLQHEDGVNRAPYVVAMEGGLQWVFVYVKEGITGDYSDSAPVVLDQRGCQYHPHVFGIMAGQPLQIVNSDETLHNIHSLPKESRPFNLAMPTAGMKLEQKFRKPEAMVRIKCDVHPWMESYAGVLSHPFYSVTGEDGTFSLSKLPAGTYTVEAWHEKGGSQTQTVTVGEGESAQITFSFKAA